MWGEPKWAKITIKSTLTVRYHDYPGYHHLGNTELQGQQRETDLSVSQLKTPGDTYVRTNTHIHKVSQICMFTHTQTQTHTHTHTHTVVFSFIHLPFLVYLMGHRLKCRLEFTPKPAVKPRFCVEDIKYACKALATGHEDAETSDSRNKVFCCSFKSCTVMAETEKTRLSIQNPPPVSYPEVNVVATSPSWRQVCNYGRCTVMIHLSTSTNNSLHKTVSHQLYLQHILTAT